MIVINKQEIAVENVAVNLKLMIAVFVVVPVSLMEPVIVKVMF